ncbi:hypothetical protein RSW36_27130, partial [Escherichia coli]|nr:hypothetical protein [Escherichia coli]
VRQGEKSQFAIFYKTFTKEVASPVTGAVTDEVRAMLRSYAVFNVDQIEGLPADYYPSRVALVAPGDVLPDRADRFVRALPASVQVRG